MAFRSGRPDRVRKGSGSGPARGAWEFGDVKSVGGGVLEKMRVDFGPGYRVYFGRKGRVVYLLLCGGDKSTQKADIKRAKAMWATIQKEQS